MKLKHVTIRNILGIEELETDLGHVTEIVGRNGSGKSSVIEAIKYALGGGTDATLIRKGAKEGEVVLLLDDGTTVGKKATGDKDSPKVRRPDVGMITAGQTYLNKLHDILRRNPVELLTADAAKRGQYLLEATPMEITRKQIEETVGKAVDANELLRDVPMDKHALVIIGRVQKSIFDERTGINREAKSSRTTAEKLAMSLPEDEMSAEDLAAEKTAASADREMIIDNGAKRAGDIDGGLVDRRRSLGQQREARLDEIRAEYAELITAEEEKGSAAKQAIREEIGPKAEELRAQVAALDERIKSSAEHANTRSVIAGMEREASEKEAASEKLTTALARLEDLKRKLSGDLPLGLELGEDGDIYRDGIPFSRLNKAQQVDVAMRLSMIRAGELQFVCVDGLEALDGDTYGALLAWSAENDIQILGTRVATGQSLHVENIDREPVAA